MVQMFKILNEFDEAHLQTLKVNKESATRGHDLKIEKQHHKYKSSMNCYVARSANPWNKLPVECVHSKSVNNFKSNLNNAWKCKENKFYYDF